jgi:hypothetical protein
LADSLALYDQALHRIGPDSHPESRVRIRAGRSLTRLRAGDRAGATEDARVALAEAERIGYVDGEVAALVARALATSSREDARRCAARSRTSGDPEGVSVGLLAEAEIAAESGSLPEASALGREAAAIAGRAGMKALVDEAESWADDPARRLAELRPPAART